MELDLLAALTKEPDYGPSPLQALYENLTDQALDRLPGDGRDPGERFESAKAEVDLFLRNADSTMKELYARWLIGRA